jgi:hypothetical protein
MEREREVLNIAGCVPFEWSVRMELVPMEVLKTLRQFSKESVICKKLNLIHTAFAYSSSDVSKRPLMLLRRRCTVTPCSRRNSDPTC